MSDEITIPLFPLNVVLFPYSKLPLFIFEERYKKMINACIENETVFGINLFAEKKIYSIGCSGSVDDVVSRSETGEMNITTKGLQRYKTIKYEAGKDGYYIGNIDFIEDDNLPYDKSKMEKAVKLYNDLVEIVYNGTVKKIDLSETKWYDGKRSVTFAIAEKSGFSLIERQNLLEIYSEDKRLDYILKYFDEVIPKIKEADKIANIIKGDGYIQT